MKFPKHALLSLQNGNNDIILYALPCCFIWNRITVLRFSHRIASQRME